MSQLARNFHILWLADIPIQEELTTFFKKESIELQIEFDLHKGMLRIRDELWDCIVVSETLIKKNIDQTLQEIIHLVKNTPVIFLSKNNENGLKAISSGCRDYFVEVTPYEDVISIFKKIKASEKGKTLRHFEAIQKAKELSRTHFVAQGKKIKEIFDTIDKLAPFATTVLITGESGTGKELVAREIHNRSTRSDKPFIAINCGAIPETLMESELFGHKKGAFTDATRDKRGLFEEANGGTLFLDEIGELPLHLQVKLLRTLQEQQIRRVGDEDLVPIDVRVIAATLRDIEDDISEGRFREDLYYRLNVVSVHIPPLRERREEIFHLVKFFIAKYNDILNLKIKDIDDDVKKIFQQYWWRGNIRELENCIERAMVLTEGDIIKLSSLPEHIIEAETPISKLAEMYDESETNLSIKERTIELEKKLIVKALEQTNGNRTHAAKVLEISHRALLYKLKEYKIA